MGSETHIKTILPLINRLISEALLAYCWPRINQMLLQLIDVPHSFLINTFLCVGFSRCQQALVLHWSDFHAARDESEWCKLLWCLVAQTVAGRHLSSCWRLLLSSAPRVHKSTEPCDTRLRTSHQTWPQFCRLQIIESHSGMCSLETERDVKHHWWAVVINRMTFY